MKVHRLIVALLFSAVAYAGDSFHVTTTGGGAGNDGSLGQPWRLSYALRDSGGVVGAGDTIWVHEGNYKGRFICDLDGSAGSPVVVRNYQNGRACIYDSTGSSTTYLFTFNNCNYVWLWGLEFKGTGADKYTTNPGQPITDIDFPSGITIGSGTQNGLKVINCIVHDIGAGIEAWSNAPGMELHGNLIYYVGIENSNQLHHVYIQNSGAQKISRGNILGWPTGKGTGFHAYGQSGVLDSMSFQLNISSGTNADGGSTGILFGLYDDRYTYGGICDSNYIYKAGISFGYQSYGNWDGKARGNVQYRTGSTRGFDVDVDGPNRDVSGNICIPNGGWFHARPVWAEGVLTDSFPSNTMYTSAPLSGTWKYVIPNGYESKRANIAIFNWGDADSVWVNLSPTFSNGDSFYVYNYQNYYGDIPYSGVYQDSVKLPMTTARWTVADATACADPSNTLPEFGAFIVTGTSNGGGTPATPQPMKRLKGRKR